MARTNNLTNFLTDVATAIKTKTGDSTAIPASQFDTKIANITTGNLTDAEYEEANDDLDDILEGTEIPEELKITDTRYLFAYNSRKDALPKLLSYCKDVTQMSNMFAQSNNIGVVDLSNFDTSKVTDMTGVFNYCWGEIIGINNWDVSKVTTMNNMFQYAVFRNNSFDISNWNLASLISTGSMFFNCNDLDERALNTILKALPTAVNHPTKTLASLSLARGYATTCTTLSNWQACVDAGWTTGY